jgi:hypothetical protein
VKAVTGCTNRSPTAADAIKDELSQFAAATPSLQTAEEAAIPVTYYVLSLSSEPKTVPRQVKQQECQSAFWWRGIARRILPDDHVHDLAQHAVYAAADYRQLSCFNRGGLLLFPYDQAF